MTNARKPDDELSIYVDRLIRMHPRSNVKLLVAVVVALADSGAFAITATHTNTTTATSTTTARVPASGGGSFREHRERKA